MTTGLTPDFRPNVHKAAINDAAAEAESTHARLTADGGHPLHRALARLEDGWTSTGGTRTLFSAEVEGLSRSIADALRNHAEDLRQAARREPTWVDPAGPQGWKTR